MKRFASAVLAAMLALPAVAGAQGTLVFDETFAQNGGGLGTQLTILTVTSPGGGSNEQGCVTPSGFTCSITGTNGGTFIDLGVQQGQSQLQPLAGTGITGSTVRFVFNVTEPAGNSITLDRLGLLLFVGNNANPIFSATLPGSMSFGDTQVGVGNFGFAFGLDAASAVLFDQAVLGAGPGADIRFGAAMQASDATGGLETVNLAALLVPPTTVPEPSTYALMATGLVGVVAAARRRRTA